MICYIISKAKGQNNIHTRIDLYMHIYICIYVYNFNFFSLWISHIFSSVDYQVFWYCWFFASCLKNISKYFFTKGFNKVWKYLYKSLLIFSLHSFFSASLYMSWCCKNIMTLKFKWLFQAVNLVISWDD